MEDAKAKDLLKEGDIVVTTARVIVNTLGTANLIKVREA